jgi:hypothetical protein
VILDKSLVLERIIPDTVTDGPSEEAQLSTGSVQHLFLTVSGGDFPIYPLSPRERIKMLLAEGSQTSLV